MRNIELLAPAGSYEVFEAVLDAGADAVYLGGQQYGARAYAGNFTEEELCMAIDVAHIHDRKIYLTVNTLVKEDELSSLYDYLLPYYMRGLDAVIVQDIGVMSFIHREFPGLHIHASTQMTVTSPYGAGFVKSLGATRVVTARELSFDEIRDIKENSQLEVESFVHGALCYCYSGQCLMSSILGGRSGNRGRCAGPCRLGYDVYDEDFKRIKTDIKYPLSLKDLNTIDDIPQLISSGIDSFKIEGRMKSASYASNVVSVYREYIDKYLTDENAAYHVTKEGHEALISAGNRSGFTDAYYFGKTGSDMITHETPSHTNTESREDIPHIKRHITGTIMLSVGSPAVLTCTAPANIGCAKDKPAPDVSDVTDTSNASHISAKVYGDIVQEAKKQPLSVENIRASIEKTGQTPFEFCDLEIIADDNIFMPVKSLNALRRDALQALYDKICTGFHRDIRQADLSTDNTTDNPGSDNVRPHRTTGTFSHLSVSVQTRAQLIAALSHSVCDDIYIDSMCYTHKSFASLIKEDASHIHGTGKKAYLMLPLVFRKSTENFYRENISVIKGSGIDGIVVKSIDALQFAVSEISLPIICDHSIYNWNRESNDVLLRYNVIRTTAPLELNRSELYRLSNDRCEIMVYGYYPLMTSAQCVHANVSHCDKKPSTVYLKDRYGKYFPVKNNCADCVNTVYNTVPAMLFSNIREFKKMGFYGGRIAFSIEDERAVHAILDMYGRVTDDPGTDLSHIFKNNDYTNGHFKRGVE